MSEAKFESIARELRAAAPPAPERLRGLVRTLPNAQPRRALRLRPALSAAIAIALAIGLGAALIGGLRGSQNTQSIANYAPSAGTEKGTAQKRVELPGLLPANPYAPEDKRAFSDALTKRAPDLSPGSRLQRYGVAMSLRVRDLSRATQSAVRQTRRLGGYIAAANYSTGSRTGDSTLELRVPVQRIQQAIAGFTELGTILAQHISIRDLQAPLDRTERRIAAARKVIAALEGKSFRTPDEQTRLDAARRTVRRLSRQHANLVREGAYAKISLQLTTRKAAAQHVAPGRFDRFWGSARDILGKEAIAVLYALVVAGPFAILAAFALLAERARRRRADHRMLGETG